MTQRPFRFLNVDDVLLLHDDTLRREGGLAGIRDRGLLEAAVAMPRQQFGGRYLHADLAAMAAAILFHLAQNHPFLDGNKRVAVMAAYVFLDANGVSLDVPPRDLEAVTLDVASGRIGKDPLAAWFRKRLLAG